VPHGNAVDGKGERKLLLAIIDCDDAETLARLREIVPDLTIASHIAAEPAALPRRRKAPNRAPVLQAFTGRQREILEFLSQGLSNKEIGRRLGISHFTVRNHVSKLLQVLNIGSRREVAQLAFPEQTRLSA